MGRALRRGKAPQNALCKLRNCLVFIAILNM